MKNTGIFATKDELKRLKELATTASNTPVMAFTVGEMLSGNDWASRAWRNAKEACHALALQKGLPEIQGFYGIKADGEFVSY